MGDIEEAIAETVAVETDSGSENVSTGSVTCEGDLRIGGVIRTCGEVSTGVVVTGALPACAAWCRAARWRFRSF